MKSILNAIDDRRVAAVGMLATVPQRQGGRSDQDRGAL